MPDTGDGGDTRTLLEKFWETDEMLMALAIGAVLVLVCQLWSAGRTDLKEAFELSKSWVGLAIMLHTGKQGANALKATESPIQWPAMATLAAQLLAGVSLMLIPVSG